MKNYNMEMRTYFDAGGAINPCCLQVMPLEPKLKLQKFAIGTSQVLQYWEFKKGELTQSFKSEPQAKDISRIVISGAPDKYSIFYAGGQSIRGVTKRGKEFFKLDTSHTEVIRSLHVIGQSLWSAGEFILNCYESQNNKIMDKFFYICEDRINDMLIASVSGQMVSNAILACQDKTIKVLVENELLYQQKFDSPCTVIALSPEQSSRFCPVIGFGLKNGTIGCVELTRGEPVVLWTLDGSLMNSSSVSVIKICKLFQEEEGFFNMIVGRDDGSIEVYSFEYRSPVCTLRFETKVTESITGIEVGFITSPTRKEILIACYSGKVMSLVESGKRIVEAAGVDPKEAIANKKEKQEKVSNLQKEVELLKKKQQEIQKLEQAEYFEEAEKVGEESMPIDFGENFKASFKMNIISEEAAYSLFIDSQLPIDSLMLQSMQNIDILSVKDGVCSINKVQDKQHGNVLLATLKVQGEDSSHTRVEIKLRTSEGQMGHLNVFVIPKPSTGNMTCQVLDVPMKPLNLHERIDTIPEETLALLPLSKITITGRFSLTDGHNWISNCLPDVPPNASSDEEDSVHMLTFKSTFIGTILTIQLSKGVIQVSSDNLSVITIIKEQLSNDASTKKIVLDIQSEIEDGSIFRQIELLNPLIQNQYLVAQKHQLIDGLKELQMHEEDIGFLSDEYKDILRNADSIKAAFKLQPRKLTYMWGIIADLFMDSAKIKGHHNVQSKMGTLKQILNQYNFEELVQFFKSQL